MRRRSSRIRVRTTYSRRNRSRSYYSRNRMSGTAALIVTGATFGIIAVVLGLIYFFVIATVEHEDVTVTRGIVTLTREVAEDYTEVTVHTDTVCDANGKCETKTSTTTSVKTRIIDDWSNTWHLKEQSQFDLERMQAKMTRPHMETTGDQYIIDKTQASACFMTSYGERCFDTGSLERLSGIELGDTYTVGLNRLHNPTSLELAQ